MTSNSIELHRCPFEEGNVSIRVSVLNADQDYPAHIRQITRCFGSCKSHSSTLRASWIEYATKESSGRRPRFYTSLHGPHKQQSEAVESVGCQRFTGSHRQGSFEPFDWCVDDWVTLTDFQLWSCFSLWTEMQLVIFIGMSDFQKIRHWYS